MGQPNVRIYTSPGTITDVTPSAPPAGIPPIAQQLNGGLTYQGNSGVYVCLSGTTANRPTVQQLQGQTYNRSIAGTKYYDTTLGLMIVLDDAGMWRNPITGAML
jgi:hypothetical protein